MTIVRLKEKRLALQLILSNSNSMRSFDGQGKSWIYCISRNFQIVEIEKFAQNRNYWKRVYMNATDHNGLKCGRESTLFEMHFEKSNRLF